MIKLKTLTIDDDTTTNIELFHLLVEKYHKKMAEREGFEPSKRFPVYTLSKRAPSTTRPPLQNIF